jgi:hypothetical protein
MIFIFHPIDKNIKNIKNLCVYPENHCMIKTFSWATEDRMCFQGNSISATFLTLWKESLNSDGQQLHQYQQNEQAPLTSNHWAPQNATTYDVGNKVIMQVQQRGGLKPVNEIPPLLIIWSPS